MQISAARSSAAARGLPVRPASGSPIGGHLSQGDLAVPDARADGLAIADDARLEPRLEVGTTECGRDGRYAGRRVSLVDQFPTVGWFSLRIEATSATGE